MNEKEKMINGLHYDAADAILYAERIKCKTLCFKYNQICPEQIAQRQEIIKKIVGKTKGIFHIEPNFYCDYGYNIELGDNFYSNHNLVILDCAKVTFGDNVFIGPNSGFYTAEHPLNAKERITGAEWAKPINVGNNVWFGVTVLAGVTIGDNTVIGAGSVVTKDIPSNVVAVGNPCKIIRKIEN